MVGASMKKILGAYSLMLDYEGKDALKPYGDGHASERILALLFAL